MIKASSCHSSRFFTWSLRDTETWIATRYSCACTAFEKPNTLFRYCVILPRKTAFADRSSTTLRWLSLTNVSMTAWVRSCSRVYSVVAFSKMGMAIVLRCDGRSAVLVV